VSLLLTDRWLGTGPRLRIIDDASVALVREHVRQEGRALGLSKTVAGAAVNVASELGYNQLAHARGGEIAVRRIRRANVEGLEIIAADRGPGIGSPSEALDGRTRTSEAIRATKSLGVGLQAVLELSDEVDFDIRLGEGTCVWARKFAERPPWARRQVGVYGRPCPEEVTSGDDGLFLRRDEDLLLVIADGLGHGVPAREASEMAMEAVVSAPDGPPDHLLARCHAALGKTRGAVMSIARIAEPGDVAAIGCAGNTSVHIYGIGATRRFSGPSFVLGAPGRTPKTLAEEKSLAASDAMVLFTDGLNTKTDLEGELDLILRKHPIRIAEELVKRFGRGNDDALVLVAR
jgi:anti-sigma regulatory factor (Ser/Thr protein kinase)/serine/threonine protein phosphatase PrpC